MIRKQKKIDILSKYKLPLFLQTSSKKLTSPFLTFFFSLLISCLYFSACEFSKPSKASAPLQKPCYPTFDPETVESLTLEKSFPGETPFTLKIVRDLSEPQEKQWKLKTASVENDPYLDTSFINHLLSTLKTLSAIETPENDQPNRYGLQPKRGALHIQQKSESIHFIIGDELNNGKRYGQYKELASSQIFAGAFFRMFELIKDENSLRAQKIILKSIDDFDLFTFKQYGTRLNSVTLEREGAFFKNKKKANQNEKIIPLLEKLFQSRIKSFQIPVGLSLKPNELQFEWTLTDRKNKSIQIRLFKKDSLYYMQTSERGAFFFEIYPETILTFKEFFL